MIPDAMESVAVLSTRGKVCGGLEEWRDWCCRLYGFFSHVIDDNGRMPVCEMSEKAGKGG